MKGQRFRLIVRKKFAQRPRSKRDNSVGDDHLDAIIHHRQAPSVALSECGVGHARLRRRQIHHLYSR